MRRQSLIRFVTFFAVLASFSGASLGDETSPRMALYGDRPTSVPKYRTWNGSAWSAQTSMPSLTNVAEWVVAKNCPVRNEIAAALCDDSNALSVCIYDGASWGNLITPSTNVGSTDERRFSLAYEQSSGNAMVTYRVGSTGSILYYRIWNGVTWGSQQSTSYSGSGAPMFVKMVAKTGSNEIMIVVLDSNSQISAMTWNGSAFGNKVLLETSALSSTTECFDATYERTSGRCMVAWAKTSSTTPQYRIWSGSAWASAATMPSVGGSASWFRLAGDPASNKIIAMTLDSGSDVNAFIWSGTSWGSATEFETNASATDRRAIEIAFEPDGTRAVACYGDASKNNLMYRTYNGSAWSAETSGPALGNVSGVVMASPSTSGQEIMIAVERRHDGGFWIMRWTGSSMANATFVSMDVAGQGVEAFTLPDCNSTTLVPASIPYSTDFESRAGAEWSPQSTLTNTTYTTFAGNYRTTNLKLSLNTTIGETYRVVYDLYTVDAWAGSSATNGPDYFTVSMNGTQIFKETFMHDSNITGFAFSYPFKADQFGSYGYSGNFTDGIFRGVESIFTATTSPTIIGFAGQMKGDPKWWGIDNVKVTTARFLDVSASKGFNVTTNTSEQYGSGLHWADFNNDGYLDCIITGDTSKLMKNMAGQSFTATAFGSGNVQRQGALVDINNDGNVDFWGLTNAGLDVCYLGNGAYGFTNAGNYGFSGANAHDAVAMVDINRNGWCDLFSPAPNGNWLGIHQGALPVVLSGTTASDYGLSGLSTGQGAFCCTGDLNNDGYPDMYYHYDTGRVFVSKGDGTYIANKYGMTNSTAPGKRVGPSVADYNNDGKLDVIVPLYDGGNASLKLWRNDVNWTGNSGTFSSSTLFNRLNDTAGQRGTCWGDYDNDGFLDLLVTTVNGTRLWHNNGDGTFSPANDGSYTSGKCLDAVFVDYDNDGDLDIAITRENLSTVLLQNRTNNNNYLKVRVVGRGAGGTNVSGAGTRVELWNSTGTTLLGRRDIGVARGYGGTEPLIAHFGGVSSIGTYKVKVYFGSRAANDPQVVSAVVPVSTTSVVGSTTLAQTLTVTEPTKLKIMKWREVTR